MTPITTIRKKLREHFGAGIDQLDAHTLGICQGSVVVIVHLVDDKIYLAASIDRGGESWDETRVAHCVEQIFGQEDDAELIVSAILEFCR